MVTTVANVDVLRRSYNRWITSRGKEYRYWFDVFSAQFHFSSAGGGRNRPGYFQASEREEHLKAYFEGIVRDWKMIEFRTEEFIAQGDRVVVRIFCEWQYRRTGKTVSTHKLDYWRFEDGKAVEYYESFDTAAMIEAMTPDPVPERSVFCLPG